jgi:hypothetical protein
MLGEVPHEYDIPPVDAQGNVPHSWQFKSKEAQELTVPRKWLLSDKTCMYSFRI